MYVGKILSLWQSYMYVLVQPRIDFFISFVFKE